MYPVFQASTYLQMRMNCALVLESKMWNYLMHSDVHVSQLQEMQENVKKCKNFLATLIKLASHNSPSPDTSKNVKTLVQDLLVRPEHYPLTHTISIQRTEAFIVKSVPSVWLFLLNGLLFVPQDAKIEPEEFTSRLQAELKSSPQPYLIPFLKVLPQRLKEEIAQP